MCKESKVNMKLKLLITILVLTALFSGVMLWRVDRFVYGDRMARAEAQARTQLSSLSQAINTEIQSSRRMLSSVNNDSFKRERVNWRVFQPYYALALMTTQGGTLSISRMVSKANSPAANWTMNELGQYIGFMGKELESKGTILLRSFKDPKKNRHVAVIFAGGGNAYILIGSGENFQSLIESQKGSMSAISIIASDGLTISHAIPDYIGNVMSDSTMLKEIRMTGAAQGLGAYQQGKRQIFGMYSQIPGTNSYVISSLPIAELVKGRLSLAWQFVFMAVGISLLGTAMYFWQEKRVPAVAATATPAPRMIPTAQKQALAPTVSAPKAQDPPAMLPPSMQTSTPTVITPKDLQQEKVDAYRQVATALGQEMRSPLASILGFSQMVLSKTQDPDVVQAVESILREARSSRDVLEKLVTFTGDRSTDKTVSKIEGPIMQALKNLDLKINQKGVRVEKDFKETSPWALASTDITKAFENLFLNAIEAMERMQEKILRVSTWEAADGLHVTISDSGEGIEMENVAKVFDPFFTTRSFAQHVGLGLPVVVGILKEHNGKIQIQSKRGKGTQIEIVFGVKTVAATVTSLLKAPPPLSRAELPTDLPKTPASDTEVPAALKEPEQKIVPQTVPQIVPQIVPQAKLMDMNVDSLLELPSDDEPLQFLEGQGFDDPPTPLPVKPPEPPPATPPPVVQIADGAPIPPVFEVSDEDQPEATLPTPSVVIDMPASAAMMVKKTALDSYKVAVRRPGKRN
jgi:signal transduction histidine kinase